MVFNYFFVKKQYRSEVNKLGFFGDSGPLRIFVSGSSMHDSYEFYEAAGGSAPYYQSTELNETIRIGTALRIRLLGVRYEQQQMYAFYCFLIFLNCELNMNDL